jgi:hypothetical protein
MTIYAIHFFNSKMQQKQKQEHNTYARTRHLTYIFIIIRLTNRIGNIAYSIAAIGILVAASDAVGEAADANFTNCFTATL